jgi:hypothetical protein
MAMRPKLWTANALAVELQIDRRTLNAKLGSIPPDGKSELRDAWLLVSVLAALGWGRPQRTRGARVSGNADYEQWRARWMKQRALDAEREARVRQGNLVELEAFVAAMTETWKRILLLARNRFLGFPSKLAANFPRFTDQAAIFTWSTAEVGKILDLLANSKAVAFEGPYRIPRYEIEDVNDEEDADDEADEAGMDEADVKKRTKSGA